MSSKSFPIFKSALDLSVYLETIVKGFAPKGISSYGQGISIINIRLVKI